MVSESHQQQRSRSEFLATAENPFHFVDCGLDNVYLVGIRYFEEPDGRVIAEIPAVKHLMRFIAQEIVKSPLDLSGQQIKFLRKRLGKKATEFCQYLGVEPETLSRMENGKQPISTQVQKLARLSYCTFSEDPALVGSARNILQSFVENVSTSRQRIVLEIGANREWTERKAA